jgi:AcrR family transcriptional regulator
MLQTDDMVKSRRDEYKALTRAAVLDAAADQFIERGFAETTIEDVANGARVSKGTVYYHFTDKAELFEAVFRDRQSALVENLARAVAEESGGPWARLRVGLSAYLDQTVDNAEHRALLQVAPAALGAQRCREIDEAMGVPILRAALQDIADAGQLPQQSLDMAARILFAALCEAAMAAGSHSDPPQARRDAALVLDAVITGLQSSGPTDARSGENGGAPTRTRT